jgi:hypothetical protein
MSPILFAFLMSQSVNNMHTFTYIAYITLPYYPEIHFREEII